MLNFRYLLVEFAPEPWSSLEVGDDGCVGPSGKLLCLGMSNPQKNMLHMHYTIPFLFDFCPSPSTKELHA